MSSREDRLDRLLLAQEITEFLYREAELLDERRYRDWLALLADDIRYWMPMRRNVKYGESEREFTRAAATSTGSTKARRRSPARQADRDRHPLGRGAGLAHLAPRFERADRRGRAIGCRGARGRCQMPLPDLPQPGRDRDRHPGRQARGFAARRRTRLADRAAQDHPRPERAAEQKSDVLLLTGKRKENALTQRPQWIRKGRGVCGAQRQHEYVVRGMKGASRRKVTSRPLR